MITIVDYRAGNLTSVKLAFEHLGVPCEISADPAKILAAERLVFPGVGAAGAAMRNIIAQNLATVLRQVVRNGTPFMGLCLGAQVILDSSEENGGTACLSLLAGQARRFHSQGPDNKVPHMGWNQVRLLRPHPVMQGIENGCEFYFVHSYFPVPSDDGVIVGQTDYAGVAFASILGRDNLVATQFHPEKSGAIGLRILQNFSRWDGQC